MKRPFLVLVGSVVLSLLSVGASAYDCTSGGEQISITSALFLFGEAPDPNTSQNIVWFEGITSRSPRRRTAVPGLGSNRGLDRRGSGRRRGKTIRDVGGP